MAYSLKRSTHILRRTAHLLQRKRKKLSHEVALRLSEALHALQDAIMKRDRTGADTCAREVESLAGIYLRKTFLDQVRELVFALGFALVVAIIVRQMWFEFYEIPSGSMRPTFKEQDRLVVSKTNFGINCPLRLNQFYFDPQLVKRSGVIVFTGEEMDIRDVDTMYFYLFPGKKQYIKRMLGKPGDVLYFYGGKMYGVDAAGHDISPLLQLAQLRLIDHSPFIDFERKVVTPPAATAGVFSPVFIYQMNEPIAKLSVDKRGTIQGEIMPQTQIHSKGAPLPSDYGALWGIDNFGMTRLLTAEEMQAHSDADMTGLEAGMLYLEIAHHPSFIGAKVVRDEYGRLRPTLGLSTTLLPLHEAHLRKLFDNLYTARFCVQNGIAYRYGSSYAQAAANSYAPRLPDVPDGCYEFYYGKAYEVKWQGWTVELPKSHPLYNFSPERLQLFYNVGIEWDLRFAPQVKNQSLTPARYTYFRNGDLFLLGAPILKKGDPSLATFVQRENTLHAATPSYPPFVDAGPPLKSDGTLDVELIQNRGLVIPPKSYLALGDNHAMSSDSRDFGFVPQTNLRGAPDLIFWPPGPRWGLPNQPQYLFFNGPRTIVWALAALCIGGGTVYWKRRNKLPMNF